MCCRRISDGSHTASWVWHGLTPLLFAGYLPSQQPDICGVNHSQLFHRRKLSSSINNNSSPVGISVFACRSSALLLPFSLLPSTSSTGEGYQVPAADQLWAEKRDAGFFLLIFVSIHTQGISEQCYKRQQKFLVKNNGDIITCKIVSDKVAWFVPFIVCKTWGTGHRPVLCQERIQPTWKSLDIALAFAGCFMLRRLWG